jgi:DNA-binding transcriptional regulator GbsR (MarR family)
MWYNPVRPECSGWREDVMEARAGIDRKQFAEEFGILFERMGGQPMAGRVWGLLLTADPPAQTAAEIAEALSCSRSSVSTATDVLMQMGLVERAAAPGRRSRLYRVAPGGFTPALRLKMAVTSAIREVVERGLEMMEESSPAARRALEEYRECCLFFEREFPALIERWERERTKR